MKNDGLDLSHYPSAKELRAWAEAKKPGAVHRRGQLPRFLILAWDRANPDRPYVKSQSHHGTIQGYNQHDCRCVGCRAAWVRYYEANRDSRDEDLADTF